MTDGKMDLRLAGWRVRVGAGGFEIRVAGRRESDRCVFDVQAGAELAAVTVAIIHDEVGAFEAAVEFEVALPLSDVDVPVFEGTEFDHGVRGAAPAIVDGAAEFERLSGARRNA